MVKPGCLGGDKVTFCFPLFSTQIPICISPTWRPCTQPDTRSLSSLSPSPSPSSACSGEKRVLSPAESSVQCAGPFHLPALHIIESHISSESCTVPGTTSTSSCSSPSSWEPSSSSSETLCCLLMKSSTTATTTRYRRTGALLSHSSLLFPLVLLGQTERSNLTFWKKNKLTDCFLFPQHLNGSAWLTHLLFSGGV